VRMAKGRWRDGGRIGATGEGIGMGDRERERDSWEGG